jgi:hypothetical protein
MLFIIFITTNPLSVLSLNHTMEYLIRLTEASICIIYYYNTILFTTEVFVLERSYFSYSVSVFRVALNCQYKSNSKG